jgi:hypothetical protein
VQPSLQRKISKYYIFCLCVFSLRYLACNAHAPRHLWPVQLYHIFPQYLTNRTIFGKTSLNTKFLFRFYLQYLHEMFLLLRIIKLGIIINVHTSLCKVLVILFGLARTLNFLDRFSKNIQISVSIKFRPMGAKLFHVDGRLTILQTRLKAIYFGA